MCAYPENESLAQLKQRGTDRLLSDTLSFRIMQAIECGEWITYMKCPWFSCQVDGPCCVLPGLSQGVTLATSAPAPAPGSAGGKSWDPGRSLEMDSGAATWGCTLPCQKWAGTA